MSERILVVDEGNTSIKAGLFSENELMEVFKWDSNIAVQSILELQRKWGSLHVYCSTVIRNSVLSAIPGICVFIHSDVKSLQIQYGNPAGLGHDRVLAALGAKQLFPQYSNMLIFDLGTCVTQTLLQGGQSIIGLVISPGRGMRAKALHTFTSQLPALDGDHFTENNEKFDTIQNLEYGAFLGWKLELEKWICYWKSRINIDAIVFTGTDSRFVLDLQSEQNIIKEYLNLYGLNQAWNERG
jgi:type III pantothenate kinase